MGHNKAGGPPTISAPPADTTDTTDTSAPCTTAPDTTAPDTTDTNTPCTTDTDTTTDNNDTNCTTDTDTTDTTDYRTDCCSLHYHDTPRWDVCGGLLGQGRQVVSSHP